MKLHQAVEGGPGDEASPCPTPWLWTQVPRVPEQAPGGSNPRSPLGGSRPQVICSKTSVRPGLCTQSDALRIWSSNFLRSAIPTETRARTSKHPGSASRWETRATAVRSSLWLLPGRTQKQDCPCSAGTGTTTQQGTSTCMQSGAAGPRLTQEQLVAMQRSAATPVPVHQVKESFQEQPLQGGPLARRDSKGQPGTHLHGHNARPRLFLSLKPRGSMPRKASKAVGCTLCWGLTPPLAHASPTCRVACGHCFPAPGTCGPCTRGGTAELPPSVTVGEPVSVQRQRSRALLNRPQRPRDGGGDPSWPEQSREPHTAEAGPQSGPSVLSPSLQPFLSAATRLLQTRAQLLPACPPGCPGDTSQELGSGE